MVIIAGVYFQALTGYSSKSETQQCEQLVQEFYGDSDDVKTTVLPRCREPGMVAVIVAKANDASAVEAAQAVSAANKTNLSHNRLSYYLLGIGIVATAIGVTSIVQAMRIS
ncbi:hypothetical protein AB4Y96_16200 [Phyllobacterium sp. TAF24]|uniref:hypothetical protein n=1 Tax=Phyllobacterium sp. TAF24 TaxID=3233068 RepID=UPI003F977539